MDKVHNYIKDNWKNTIRVPGKDDTNTYFKMPAPYISPCADELFVNFFYWDTYFANIGLCLDGMEKQAENNLDVMAFFIQKLGYVPNADHLIFRTQPPLFTRGVYDLYKVTGDLRIINKYKTAIIREMDFFRFDRSDEIGLSFFSAHEPKQGLEWYYDEFERRLNGFTEEEKKINKYTFAVDLLAIAESGWDFNYRFNTKTNRFASSHFYHLDLNCILFDAEAKASEMFALVGDDNLSETFKKKANTRKELINKYLFDEKQGIYLDYNFVDKTFSNVTSAASLYPYALGISKDKEGALKVYSKLKLPYGLSTAPYRGDVTYFQWDYPTMWPSNAYFAYEALKNVGAKDKAEEMRKLYMDTVERVFEKTGKLWEKYNALTGAISETIEYSTPAMMGWTAGIYEYFYSKEEK